MRKSIKSPRKAPTKRKSINGELIFTVNGNEIALSLSGKVSSTGKTIVFRSTKEDYLENGIGTNIWIDLDLI